MTITIYTTPNCQGCKLTKKLFEKEHIPFEEIDISDNPRLIEKMRKLGHQQAPIVMTENAHWSGFQPDRVKSAIAYYRPESDLVVHREVQHNTPTID